MKNNIDKITASIIKKMNKLETLEQKRAELDAEIKNCKEEKAELEAQLKAEKLDVFAGMMKKNGVAVDDLLEAALSGDFLTLQETLECNTKSQSAEMQTNDAAATNNVDKL